MLELASSRKPHRHAIDEFARVPVKGKANDPDWLAEEFAPPLEDGGEVMGVRGDWFHCLTLYHKSEPQHNRG